MSIKAGTVYVDVMPDFVGFRANMNRGISSQTRSTGGLFRNLGLNWGALLAGGIGAGLVGLGAVLTKGIQDAQEAAQITAELEAGIKSTGGAANLTADQMNDLATEISLYSAVGDEVIAKGESILTTFVNISDEVGHGNDIFTQATKLMTDMAVRMDTDVSSAAVQLGKALNDPINGLTSLGRVGVKFTDAQKVLIQRLVESGHRMEAQKIILGELREEFGGTARAVGNQKPWDKLKNAIGEIIEKIGSAFLPTINRMARRISRFVQSEEFQEWVETATEWLERTLPRAIDKAADFFTNTLVPALANAWSWFGRIVDLIQNAVSLLGQFKDAIESLPAIPTGTFSPGNIIKNAFPGLPIPGMAAGGSIGAGQMRWVGERGRELFVPGTNGTIVPNHQLRAGGTQHFIGRMMTPFGPADVEMIADDAANRAIEGLLNGGR